MTLTPMDPQHPGAEVLDHIASLLDCRLEDVTQICPLTRGNTNLTFSFSCKGCRYVYRHPGPASHRIIDRERERLADLKARELDLDPSLLFCDPVSGWKLSRYIDNVDFDYTNFDHEGRGLDLIRQLHSGPVRHSLGWRLDMVAAAGEMQALTPPEELSRYPDFLSLRPVIEALYPLTQKDGYGWEMCHNDCCDSNILLGADRAYLIDWEYAADNDPAADLASYIIGFPRSEAQVRQVLERYFGRALTSKEDRHYRAWLAISAYYFLSWGLYQLGTGNQVQALTDIWFPYLWDYGPAALEAYGKIEM